MSLLLPPPEAKSQPLYGNPVIGLNCPDPSILDDRERSGYFYAYTTQNSFESAMKKDSSPVIAGAEVVNLPIYRSKDLVNWEFVCDGFPGGAPDWVKGAKLWAPDINYIGGRYVLYYALGKWGGLFSSACGAAVADSPEGPFEDYDKLVDFKSAGTLNSIDPCFFSDHNGNFLLWGNRGGGIYGIELTDDGLFIKPGARKKRLSASNTGAALLHEREGWYYLFASAGSCCRGDRSSYRIIVGRSRHPLGPYTGPDGRSMLKLNYRNTIMQSGSDRIFIGPGHNSGIITDNEGSDWMLYHCYNVSDSYTSRQLNLDRVRWDKNGWPYFESGEPSGSSPRPLFNAAGLPANSTGKEIVQTASDAGKALPQLPGGYSQGRRLTDEELEMFNRLTGNPGMILTPLTISTQVVAGMNYLFHCICEDAGHRVSGECRIVIFKPLDGEPEITEMTLLR